MFNPDDAFIDDRRSIDKEIQEALFDRFVEMNRAEPPNWDEEGGGEE